MTLIIFCYIGMFYVEKTILLSGYDMLCSIKNKSQYKHEIQRKFKNSF